MSAESSGGLPPSACLAGTGKMIAMQRCTLNSSKTNRTDVPEHPKRFQEPSGRREKDVLPLRILEIVVDL